MDLPDNVLEVMNRLENASYEAYVVGGAVRDWVLSKEAKDYDLATSARPEEVESVFSNYKTYDLGKKYGTIGILLDGELIEVTSFRKESSYLNGRQPSKVEFTRSLDEDLIRRDFTINAMAYNKSQGLIDRFSSMEDIRKSIIRSIGDPKKRFEEDYLRILRAIRLASQLGFKIEERTYQALIDKASGLRMVSMERIRDEFSKILLSKNPSLGIGLLKGTGILEMIIPEFIASYDFDQKNPHHFEDVFSHSLRVLDLTDRDLITRLAALFHDIGKPSSFKMENGIGRFYGHHKLGEEMAVKILERLRYPKDTCNRVGSIIRNHMNLHNDFSDKGLKRLLAKLGEEDTFRLIDLQVGDSLSVGSRENVEKLELRKTRIEEILESSEPYEKKQLAINGNHVIELGYGQGELIGEILDYLYGLVLENPELNEKDLLISEIRRKFT